MSGVFLIDPKLPSDQSAERIGDLAVSRHGGGSPVDGITVDVVTAAVSHELAPRADEFANEIDSLHDSISIGLDIAPCGGAIESSCIIR